jgi:hypothetical protein
LLEPPNYDDARLSVMLDRVRRRGQMLGRRQRLGRWISAFSALVVAAGLGGLALAVTAPAVPGHPAASQPPARLAAWTVVRHADGTVFVTIREFRDPAGLQRKLRANGVPASVIFYPGKLQRHMPLRKLFHVKHNSCQQYRGGQGQLQKVVPPQRPASSLRDLTIFIHPSALPSGAGIQFITASNIGHLQTYGTHMLGVWLVQANPQCTGS